MRQGYCQSTSKTNNIKIEGILKNFLKLGPIHRIHIGGRVGEASVREHENETREDRK